MLEVSARAIGQEKEIKGIQTWNKELKLLPFTDDIILHIEPKGSIKRLLELIGQFDREQN